MLSEKNPSKRNIKTIKMSQTFCFSKALKLENLTKADKAHDSASPSIITLGLLSVIYHISIIEMPNKGTK